MSIHLRPAIQSDASFIADYNRQMAWETEHKELDLETVTKGVLAVFDDPKKGFYLVADNGEKVIGQLMVTLEWSDWRNGWFWWIQSVYVHPDSRKQGIFRQLFESVIELAKAEGNVVGVRLYVEEENHRAQQVYQRLQMSDTGYLVYERMIK
jgi:GNAT superfamily N-acetyltransferase